jgi:tetratricopeptide (TPR) repeat protein
LSSVLIPPEIRTCGTCGSAECECEAVLAELDARAGSLARDGFRAAAEGRLHHAATRLGEALWLNARDAAACAVLGLCRLALGDAPGARAAWRLAETDDCAAWLRSLEDGELRDAFGAHDAALASARDGDHGAALAALDRALAIVPDLVPAARLRGLVLLVQGDAGAAREAWSAALAVCRDDPALLRLLAETPAPPRASAPVAAAETPRPARTSRIAPFAAVAGTAAVAAGIAALLAWPRLVPRRGGGCRNPARDRISAIRRIRIRRIRVHIRPICRNRLARLARALVRPCLRVGGVPVGARGACGGRLGGRRNRAGGERGGG